MPWYIDTSAAAKLVVDEEDAPALRAWVRGESDELVACDLLETELLRATRRLAALEGEEIGAELMSRAREVIESIDLVPIPRRLFRLAGVSDPPQMRSLDALHLAAVADLGDALDGLVTYDARLAAAARQQAIAVITPS